MRCTIILKAVNDFHCLEQHVIIMNKKEGSNLMPILEYTEIDIVEIRQTTTQQPSVYYTRKRCTDLAELDKGYVRILLKRSSMPQLVMYVNKSAFDCCLRKSWIISLLFEISEKFRVGHVFEHLAASTLISTHDINSHALAERLLSLLNISLNVLGSLHSNLASNSAVFEEPR